MLETFDLTHSEVSDIDELLSQLEDESLLELNIHSFRYASGKFLVEDHRSDGEPGPVNHEEVERYEKLKIQSSGAGRQAEGEESITGNGELRPTTREESEESSIARSNHPSRSKEIKNSEFTENEALDADLGARFTTLKARSTSSSHSELEQADHSSLQKKPSREIIAPSHRSGPPPPPQSMASSKKSSVSCFCLPPLKSFKGKGSSKKSSKAASKISSIPSNVNSASKTRLPSGNVVEITNRTAPEGSDSDLEVDAVLNELDELPSEDEEKEFQGLDTGVDEDILVDPKTFSVKERAKELRKASKKERKLTQEADKFTDWVKVASSRFDASLSDDEEEVGGAGRKKDAK